VLEHALLRSAKPGTGRFFRRRGRRSSVFGRFLRRRVELFEQLFGILIRLQFWLVVEFFVRVVLRLAGWILIGRHERRGRARR
jgi:hypothetical protein